MTLHIFNPEHDIALAADNEKFTASHVVRQLRADIGFIPSLWAEEGDLVLLDDSPSLPDTETHLLPFMNNVEYIQWKDLKELSTDNLKIEAWGWDNVLKYKLNNASEGTLDNILPDDEYISGIREMSSRKWAASHLLQNLVDADSSFIGAAEVIYNFEELGNPLSIPSGKGSYQYVMKAPWSSSGRGLRYIDLQKTGINSHQIGWIKNIIKRQGYIMIEPYYNKVMDFGMEFMAHGNGEIEYCGLSVFDTINGEYAGNLLTSEEEKIKLLGNYIDIAKLDIIKETIKESFNKNNRISYTGPFGIDMMITDGSKIHPCVELNLRRTMGHVALALGKRTNETRVMRMSYNSGHYQMHIYRQHITRDDTARP